MPPLLTLGGSRRICGCTRFRLPGRPAGDFVVSWPLVWTANRSRSAGSVVFPRCPALLPGHGLFPICTRSFSTSRFFPDCAFVPGSGSLSDDVSDDIDAIDKRERRPPDESDELEEEDDNKSTTSAGCLFCVGISWRLILSLLARRLPLVIGRAFPLDALLGRWIKRECFDVRRESELRLESELEPESELRLLDLLVGGKEPAERRFSVVLRLCTILWLFVPRSFSLDFDCSDLLSLLAGCFFVFFLVFVASRGGAGAAFFFFSAAELGGFSTVNAAAIASAAFTASLYPIDCARLRRGAGDFGGVVDADARHVSLPDDASLLSSSTIT